MDQFVKQLPLALDTGIEIQLGGCLYRLHNVERRLEATEGAGVLLQKLRIDFRLATRSLHLVLTVPYAVQRRGGILGDQRLAIGNGVFAQTAFLGQFVDQAQAERLLGGNRLARGDDIQRCFHAHQTRQTLGATRTRQNTQMHFRQAHLGRWHRDPAMAGQSGFKPPAQSRAKDGCHHRLFTVFQQVEDLVETRLAERLAQFGNVGTGKEGAARAGQHNALHLRVSDQGLQPVKQGRTHRVAQRIYRRAVDGQNPDLTYDFDRTNRAHPPSPSPESDATLHSRLHN